MKQVITLTAGLSVVQILSACGPDAFDSARTRAASEAIVGGDPATAGMFPGIVSLRKVGGHACGGTLIAPNWVLTAGHCMDPGFRGGVTEVVAGSLVVSSPSGEHLPVWRAYRHGQYASVTRTYEIDHDYALLRLESNAKEPSVKLATQGDMSSVVPKTELSVAGWGDTSYGGLPSDKLLYTKVPLVDRSECAKSYTQLPEETLCAGLPSGGKDACQGDSGGPLFAQVGGIQKQVGIVSSGKDCALPAWYGLYAGVSSASDWVSTTMAQGERDVARLGACVASCDAKTACNEGEDAEQCQLRNDTCLCACAGESTGLCDLSLAGPMATADGGTPDEASATADAIMPGQDAMDADASWAQTEGTIDEEGTLTDGGVPEGEATTEEVGTTDGEGETADGGTFGGEGTDDVDGASSTGGEDTTVGDDSTAGDDATAGEDTTAGDDATAGEDSIGKKRASVKGEAASRRATAGLKTLARTSAG